MTQQSLRVLLVSDEANLRDRLAKYLCQIHGYHVNIADSQEALTRLNEAQGYYEVVLIDDLFIPRQSQMPESFGVILIRKIKDLYPEIEIIIFTGWGIQSALEALRAGAYRYLIKPFNLEELDILIQTAAEYSRLRRNAHEKHILERLIDTSAVLFSGLNLQNILQVTLNEGLRTIRTDEGSIMFVNLATNKLEIKARLIQGEFIAAEPHQKMSLDEGIAGYVATTGKPYNCQDVSKDPHFVRSFTGRSIRSLLSVPIVSRGRVLGIINADNKQPYFFTEDDKQFLSTLANQVAVAIETQRLRDIKLLSNLTLDETLAKMVESACILTGTEASTIFLTDEKSGEIIRVAKFPPTQEKKFGPRQKDGLTYLILKSDEPIIISNVQQDSRVRQSVRAEGVKALIGVPLKIRIEDDSMSEVKTIGVLFANTIHEREFSDHDVDLLQRLANQGAIAIRNAQLYEQVQRQVSDLQMLQQVAVSLSSTSEFEEVLCLIITEAVKLTHSHEGSILFWDVQTEKFTQAFRTDSNGKVQSYHSQARTKDGITRKIIDTQKPVVIPDTEQISDINPVFRDKGYRATLGVPLLSQQQAVGVLYVRSKEPRQFSDRQIALLKTLASQAMVAIAIDRARLQKELTKTKGLLRARTAVAWLGMISATWRHAIEGYSITVREEAQKIRSELPISTRTRVSERLIKIEQLAGKILDKPVTPLLSEEGSVESVHINNLLRERIGQLWRNEPYTSVRYQLDFCLSETMTVRVDPIWLRQVFDILVDNAIEAMIDVSRPELTISTRVIDTNLEIIFTDVGQGISEDILSKLFHEQIEKPQGAKGLGMGLLMAQTIAQTYGGEIRVESTNSTGTTMVVSLPIETK